MKNKPKILLPGSDNQLSFVMGTTAIKDKQILVMGSGSEPAVIKFIELGANKVELIIEDYESLLNAGMLLEEHQSVTPKMMDFELTDFEDNSFDIIYAQASISGTRKNKITKEIKRILKPEGILAAGEIIKLEKDIPPFIQDIFDSSDLAPLFIEDIDNYYKERSFEVTQKQDYSKSLKYYYSLTFEKLKDSEKELTEKEKSYYKKLLNQLSHHSQAYLKHGGDKYIGFVVVLAKKI